MSRTSHRWVITIVPGYSSYIDCNSLPHTVPDPCSSSPCEVNAACVRDSVMTDSFTCTCIPPFEANGISCEGWWLNIGKAQSISLSLTQSQIHARLVHVTPTQPVLGIV